MDVGDDGAAVLGGQLVAECGHNAEGRAALGDGFVKDIKRVVPSVRGAVKRGRRADCAPIGGAFAGDAVACGAVLSVERLSLRYMLGGVPAVGWRRVCGAGADAKEYRGGERQGRAC